MTEVALFDMDGVLLEGDRTDPGVYRAAAHDALREYDIRRIDDGHASVLEASEYRAEMTDACRSLGIDCDEWWQLRESSASRRANARIRSGERSLYPDAEAVLELPDELPTGLVSNNRRETAEFVADYCFPGRFDVAIGRNPTIADYHRKKPDPEFLKRALAALNVRTPESGYYVGDRGTDVLAAERVGLESILIERPHVDVGTLASEPDHVVPSLREAVRIVTDLGGE
ncbi:HAD family hydrolase [Halopenitus sp. H-Gu1]|uniref:HAD family hydrolase n=1 Tax=Halopenitus sp. H-Gu1 TaxID=3242697 RepID=UPI00359D893A